VGRGSPAPSVSEGVQGSGPAAPREALTEAKRALQEYAASLGHDGPVLGLPEPAAEDLDLARELLAKGLRLFA